MDISEAMDEIESAVGLIQTFPGAAERPEFREMDSRTSMIRLIIRGDIPERSLKELAHQVGDDLSTLPNVSHVETTGTRNYEISIEVPPARLRADARRCRGCGPPQFPRPICRQHRHAASRGARPHHRPEVRPARLRGDRHVRPERRYGDTTRRSRRGTRRLSGPNLRIGLWRGNCSAKPLDRPPSSSPSVASGQPTERTASTCIGTGSRTRMRPVVSRDMVGSPSAQRDFASGGHRRLACPGSAQPPQWCRSGGADAMWLDRCCGEDAARPFLHGLADRLPADVWILPCGLKTPQGWAGKNAPEGYPPGRGPSGLCRRQVGRSDAGQPGAADPQTAAVPLEPSLPARGAAPPADESLLHVGGQAVRPAGRGHWGQEALPAPTPAVPSRRAYRKVPPILPPVPIRTRRWHLEARTAMAIRRISRPGGGRCFRPEKVCGPGNSKAA